VSFGQHTRIYIYREVDMEINMNIKLEDLDDKWGLVCLYEYKYVYFFIFLLRQGVKILKFGFWLVF
jgi:hypothetical protein